jgi:hypothetical protein
MVSVARPPVQRAARPALAPFFASAMALCSLAVGVLANVEPVTALLRAIAAGLVGQVVGLAFCAVTHSLYVPANGAPQETSETGEPDPVAEAA